MSINRDMKKYTLQKNQSERTGSGAQKENWQDVDTINVAVYKKNDSKFVTSEKYMESTHTGLTYYRDISAEDCRLLDNDKIFEVMDCNTESRLTNLLLKVVKGHA